MDTFKEYFDYFKGYQHVADFQRFCGVEIIELEKLENGSSDKVAESEGNGLKSHKSQVKQRNCTEHKNGFKNGIVDPRVNETKLAYKIHNKAVHALMQFGAGLGSELFYITFFPFMIWNIDSQLTRQLLLIWYPLMYCGQFLKDWVQWPRPGPPAVRLEGKRFEMEYGMPSTHTICGTCIPFSLLILTSRHYEFSFAAGLLIAILWTSLVAVSRVYMGMHTVLDCLAGLAMTAIALPWMLCFVEWVEYYQVINPFAPFVSFLIPLLACVYYPKPKEWSITRGDTSNIVSIGAVCMMVAWFQYNLGWMTIIPRPVGLQPLPPVTWNWVFYCALRTVLGVVALAGSRIITKKIFLKLVCMCARVDTKDVTKQRELGLEVPVRWFTIGGLAFSTSFIAPICFSYLGIGREGFYTLMVL